MLTTAILSCLVAFTGTHQAADVDDFCLSADDGTRVSLYGAPDDTRATVVTLTTLECPIARLLLPRLAELDREYAPRGVRFLAIEMMIGYVDYVDAD